MCEDKGMNLEVEFVSVIARRDLKMGSVWCCQRWEGLLLGIKTAGGTVVVDVAVIGVLLPVDEENALHAVEGVVAVEGVRGPCEGDETRYLRCIFLTVSSVIFF